MKQIVVWTALPYGMNPGGTRLRLSALVSPRLETAPAPAGTLADFPAFQNWPGQAIGFAVSFSGGAAVAATRISPAPDPALWASLFPPSMPVDGFVPDDYTTQTIHSYPVANVVGFLKQQYGRVGVASPTTLPAIQALLDRGFERIATLRGRQREVRDLEPELEATLRARLGTARALAPAPPEPSLDFFRVRHFHRFRGGNRGTPVTPPELDFHQALSLLSSHPALLLRLGLVVELDVPFAGQPASGTVRIVATRQVAAGDEDRAPLTAYRLNAPQRLFLPAPRPASRLVAGMLDLAAADFSVQQVDADGGALKAIDFANQLELIVSERRKTADSPTEAGLPALRTGGILVAHTGRALAQAGRFADLSTLAKNVVNTPPGAPPTFFADDLVAGYRVDVEQDGSGVWRTLCARDVTYRFGRPDSPAPLTVRDEGVVSAALTHDTTSAVPTEAFLHEALFHWDGWSLVAPRIGEAIQQNGLAHAERLDNPSGSPLELAITSTVVPGTLPRLRFGRSYRLRARATDAAGRSRPLPTTDASTASPPLVYRRFEPVEAPALMWLTGTPPEHLPGESTARLVIRSANSDPSLDGVPSPELSERLIVPPKTSVTMVEQLGKLDVAGGVDGTAATWGRLAAKDQATLPDRGAAAPATCPYLPDPLAVSAALRGLPGAAGTVVTAFDPVPDWWEANPYRLAVIEGSGPPVWDAATRTLTVHLPKARVATVRLSSVIRGDDLDLMAMWRWILDEAFDAEDVARLRALAESGGHWMITPFRELTLVHAVLQPLAAPVVQRLSPTRLLGATYASLDGEVDVHGASTGKVDLLATWSEPTGHGFERRDGNAHALEVRVHDPAAATVALAAGRHEFGDTRHRRVRYTAVATTRFREYFPAAVGAVPSNLQRQSAAAFEADVLSSARPLAPGVVYVVPTFGWESGADATAVFSRRTAGLRVYLDEPWFSSGDGELLGVTVWLGPPDLCGPAATPPALPFPAGIPQLPNALKPYATQWGRDPIWQAGNPHPLPTLAHFPRAVAVETGLSIAEREGVVLGVAGHEVGHDPERRLFYCDLDIDAGESYYPFIRLALARYQPKSVPHAELSRIVLAEFIQLAPGRMVWLARAPENPGRLAITVSGAGYRGNASFPCASQVEVRLERFLAAAEGGLGWVPASLDPVSLLDAQVIAGRTVWTGAVQLPADRPGARFRLVVEEYEYFLGDVPEFSAVPDRPFGTGKDRRLVYADAVELPEA
jgi:hypothetical protein